MSLNLATGVKRENGFLKNGGRMVYLPKEYKGLYPAEKRHKYGAKKTVIDGISFDSKKEAKRYQVLKLQEHLELITDLELQPEFVLQEGFRHCGKWYRPIKYRADFKYKNKLGNTIIEDTKGHRTKEYLIKKKMLLKRYPDINFFET